MFNLKTNFSINSSGHFQIFAKKLKMTLCNYVQKAIHFLKNSHIAYVFLKKQRKIHEFTIYVRFWKIMFFSKNTKNLNIGRIMKNLFMIWNIVNWRFSNLQFKEKNVFFLFYHYISWWKKSLKKTRLTSIVQPTPPL